MELVYKRKLCWLSGFPEFFENGNILTKALSSYPDEKMIYFMDVIFDCLEEHYGRGPHLVQSIREGSTLDNEIKIVKKNWLKGLRDVSIAQIINALIEVLDNKTIYIQFPPRSVAEYMHLCKMASPPHNLFKGMTFTEIPYSTEVRDNKSKVISKINKILIAEIFADNASNGNGLGFPKALRNIVSTTLTKSDLTEEELIYYEEEKYKVEKYTKSYKKGV